MSQLTMFEDPQEPRPKTPDELWEEEFATWSPKEQAAYRKALKEADRLEAAERKGKKQN